MKNIRIAIVTNTVPPYRIELFKDWAKQVDLSIFVAEYLPPGRHWNVIKEISKETQIKLLKTISFGFRNYKMLWPRGLYEIINSVDVVLVGGTWRTIPITWQTVRMAKRAGKRVIFWTGDFFDNYYFRSEGKDNLIKRIKIQIYFWYHKTILRYVDAVLAYGEKTANYYIKEGIDREKVFWGTQIIYPRILPKKEVISSAEVKYSRESFGIPEDAIVGLYFGYFTKRKGLEYLIDAFQSINSPNHWLVLAGDGETFKYLKQKAISFNRIVFTGYVDWGNKTYLYKLADYFVLPTLYDPWAQVIMEAMFAGLPVITTTEVGCENVVLNNKTGLIVKPANKTDLKVAMIKMEDPELRKIFKTNSIMHIYKYDLNYAKLAFMKSIKVAYKSSKIPI